MTGDYAFIAAMRTEVEGHSMAGVVYVFQRVAGTWTQVDILQAPDPTQGASFGWAIDTSGDRVLIGTNASGDQHGSAYFFHLEDGAWVLRGSAYASDPTINAFFGHAVAIQGDMAIIGAYLNSTTALQSGAAYVFEFDGDEWVQTDRLAPPSPESNDWFGESVAIFGDYAFIGAPNDKILGEFRGTAVVFRLQDGTWTYEASLVPNDGKSNDRFGSEVSMHGGLAVVSNAPLHATAAWPAAYVFELIGSTWTQVDRLAPSSGPNDGFGVSSLINDDWLMFGAPFDNERAARAGAVYIYARSDE